MHNKKNKTRKKMKTKNCHRKKTKKKTRFNYSEKPTFQYITQ